MNEYIKKLEEENKKLQEEIILYQSRFGDIREILEKEKERTLITSQEDCAIINTDNQILNGSIGFSTINNNVTEVWQPMEDNKKLLTEINNIKQILINRNKKSLIRFFKVGIRKFKRKLK